MDKNCLEQRILQSTCQLILEQGIRFLTFEQIANHANTTKMGIFRIFQTKQLLIERALKHLDQVTREKWQKTLDAHPKGLPSLKALLSDIFHTVATTQHRGCPLALSYAEHHEKDTINMQDGTNSSIQTLNWEPLHQIAKEHKHTLHLHIYQCLLDANVAQAKEKALFLSTLIDGLYLNQNNFLFTENPQSMSFILDKAFSLCE